MKKLLLLSALLIFACSSDDSNDNTSGTSNNSFNPPNWIQGVWLNEAIPTVSIGYEFRPETYVILLALKQVVTKQLLSYTKTYPIFKPMSLKILRTQDIM